LGSLEQCELLVMRRSRTHIGLDGVTLMQFAGLSKVGSSPDDAAPLADADAG